MMSPWCTGPAFFTILKKTYILVVHYRTDFEADVIIIFFFLFETKMKSGKKEKYTLREVITLVNPLRLLEDGSFSVISAAT